METNSCARIVLTTTASVEEARTLGRTLVEEQMVACASILPRIESVYRWDGKVETSSETMVLLKTDVEHLQALEERLHALHSYDVPEFLVIAVESGSGSYLQWLFECLSSGDAKS